MNHKHPHDGTHHRHHPRAGARHAAARRLLPLLVAGLGSGAAAQAAETAPSQTIVVTATRHAMVALDAPAAMSVVTREEIAARGADDVLDALRGEAGVSLQGRSIGGRKVISLRGMDSKHTLFLVDGRRVGASDGVIGHSDFQYDWIAVEDIERIEVVRGPLSVLYGSEAMAGVVHIVTRQAGDRWRGSARVEGSVADGDRGGDGHRVAARVDGPLAAGWGLRAGAATSRRGAVASPDDPRISELEGHEKTDAWIGLDWRPGDDHRIDLEHRAGDETRRADARERSGKRRYHVTENDIQRRLSSIGWEADWSTGALAGTATQLRAYESELDAVNKRTEGVAVNPPQRIGERVLEGQARRDFGAHALTAGFEARNESLRDPGLPGGRSIARHRAVYLQDEVRVARAVDLTLGLRHDDHHLYGGEWSPRVYAVWRAAPGLTVKGGVSHGFKAPNLKQIVPGARREGPNLFLGNPELTPETSDGAELGLSWAAGGRELQLMAFQQRVRDLIEVVLVTPGPVPGTGTFTYDNIARATLRGVELSYAQPLGAGFSTQVGWTYLDATDGDGERLLKRPRHAVGARLDWSQGPWTAGLRLDHSAGEWLPAPVATQAPQRGPELTRVGAHLSRQLGGRLTLTLGVDNLTDLRPADESPLITHAEPPRTWRLALVGRW
jgi:outer membrane receptor for ferrienterochelin and colicins